VFGSAVLADAGDQQHALLLVGFGVELEPCRVAAAACATAALTRCLRQRCFRSASSLLGCCWIRGRLGRLADGSVCLATLFIDCGDAARMPAPQLEPAGLCR